MATASGARSTVRGIRTDSKRSFSMVRSHPCAYASLRDVKSGRWGGGRTLSALLGGLDASAAASNALQPPIDIDSQPPENAASAISSQAASAFRT